MPHKEGKLLKKGEKQGKCWQLHRGQLSSSHVYCLAIRHTHMYTHIHTHEHTHEHVYVFVYVPVCVWVGVCLSVSFSLCMCQYACLQGCVCIHGRLPQQQLPCFHGDGLGHADKKWKVIKEVCPGKRVCVHAYKCCGLVCKCMYVGVDVCVHS